MLEVKANAMATLCGSRCFDNDFERSRWWLFPIFGYLPKYYRGSPAYSCELLYNVAFSQFGLRFNGSRFCLLATLDFSLPIPLFLFLSSHFSLSISLSLSIFSSSFPLPSPFQFARSLFPLPCIKSGYAYKCQAAICRAIAERNQKEPKEPKVVDY